ncbi:15-hydroxyprostaglandin dehydrogenase [NAD(+)]-like [Diabrotica virgifera virgifera]|uniref:15-hydroxyprostaglandin dehydrogenase [NAD(+)] n=1 Tax=Diabrotica virgifera virgifera TaxID=50390 RepID=A0A6P7H035_DIAVI|nr:15-hydroxyprostaglandin dehydrogenase [NAD(+)]-like [Diabrotica virgifera virgifera]XP_050513759.1 15-hydroxyprostaglandin dehydrogenase [NAD(+)]-like [Diabrotica virgifera virgifera]XP_050513760.1 15-hydroxyprostaglandin dehydrogenase [NAD(+)]-like [Diabrotica virgifera virgifera]XP_050513761.1 15-hydroxyprostaglandin dehydrogenase [NAD(+)]-like [Diabrotica virgifera virgifera]
MVFKIQGKVALVTGGASGLGLNFAKSLLLSGAKGVTLADINESEGKIVTEQLNKQFGKNQAIFVKTNITDYSNFEDAFKITVENFGNIDILMNNAGVAIDGAFKKSVEVNVLGTINGMILGIEHYLSKYMSGDEAVIALTSSVCGLEGYPQWPVYAATKFAGIGMVLSWGTQFHYDRTKIRVFALCPGPTHTNLLAGSNKCLDPGYEKAIELLKEEIENTQTPEHVSTEVMKLLEDSKTGSIWVIESGKPAYEFTLRTRQDVLK